MRNARCIAWDSAGVTTGAITVPLVLAIGLGIGDAIEVSRAYCGHLDPWPALLHALSSVFAPVLHGIL